MKAMERYQGSKPKDWQKKKELDYEISVSIHLRREGESTYISS